MYTRRTSKFHEIDHTADVGLRGEGSTLPALFASLAFGMLHLIHTDKKPAVRTTVQFTLEDPALDGLLVLWLSEINYQLTVNHFLPASIPELTIDKGNALFTLKARLNGSDLGDAAESIRTEIKAVTYHQLSVEKKGDVYVGRVIFDI